jgi:hypothetical protein
VADVAARREAGRSPGSSGRWAGEPDADSSANAADRSTQDGTSSAVKRRC